MGTVLGCFSSFNVKCLRKVLCRPVPFLMFKLLYCLGFFKFLLFTSAQEAVILKS